MKLIVGLGNPGLRYSATRHNIGFNVIKLLAKRHAIRISRFRSGAKSGRGLIAGHKVILALPQKFMNLSGEPIRILVDSERIKKEDLLVVCDDVNLKYGYLRLRARGTSGGHKGLKSIIENLGLDDFARLRVGVGRESLSGDITNFVLGGFNRQEKVQLKNILQSAADACESWVQFHAELTANKFNRKVQ